MKALSLLVLLVACGKPAEEPQATASASAPDPGPPEPLPPPTAEPVQTGHDCAKATALCDAGSCLLKLKNDCDKALTCDSFVTVRCRTPTDAVEAKGRGRQTFAAKTEGEQTIGASCTMGNQLVSTELSEMKCN